MTTPLYHVSYVVRGSLVGPQTVRYFLVGAPTPATALQHVEAALGVPEAGSFTVQRADGTAEQPGVLREQSASQLAA